METHDSIIRRQQRYGYAVFCDIELSKNSRKGEIEWTFNTVKLKGLVGYGITTFPFPVDVKNRANFDEDTIMVRNNSGWINGGKTDKKRHSSLEWKAGDRIRCYFDKRNGNLAMRKNDENLVIIEKGVSEGKVFYPFVAFADPTEAANGDQIEIFY